MKDASVINRRTISVGACILAVMLLLVPLFAQKDSAHHGNDTKDTLPLDGTFNYKVEYVNQILASASGDEIKEVYKYPVYSAVFLVRMTKSITVWERREGTLKTLLDIKLDGDFKNLVFLEDGKTFVIHTSRSASVYVVDREIVKADTTTKNHADKEKK